MSAPTSPTVTEGFALLLGEYDLGEYRPSAVGGEVFLGGLPRDPAVAVAVTLYSSSAPDAKHGYDQVSVLYRVRGAEGDPVGAERRAQALYDALHGLPRGTALPGSPGVVVQRFHAATSGPVHAGRDDRGRHEFTIMFSVELRRRTQHRR